MNSSDHRPSAAASLLFQKLIQEDITEPEGRQLLEILERSPESNRELFDQLYYDFNLRRVFRVDKSLNLLLEIDRLAQSEAGFRTDSAGMFRKLFRASTLRRIAATLSAAILVFGLLFYFTPRESVSSRSGRFVLEPAPIAVLAGSFEAVWKDGSPIPHPGNALGRTGVSLESGLAEFLFYNGVRVVVEGPADLSILGPDEIFSRKGSLSVNVPPSGSGFRVQTPHAVLVDYGTEFHARVTSESTAAEVVRGKVLVRYNSGKARLLETGQSYRVGSETDEKIPPTSYISPAEMHRRIETFAGTDLLRRNDRATTDRGGTLRLEFFDDEPLPRRVRHFGGETVPGRDASKRAFRFKNRSDRLEWEIGRKYESLTLSAWVRLDEPGVCGNPILTSRNTDRGAILWQVGASGSLCLGVRSEPDGAATIYESPVLLSPDHYGKWIHFETVYDASRRTVVHSMNGRVVSRHSMHDVLPITLKTLDVGNRIVDGPLGCWNGCIESVRIDDNAVTP